jgi:ABC-2 type transport system ATP-binding protein
VTEGTPAELKASVGSDVVTVQVGYGMVEHAKSLLSELDDLLEIQTNHTSLTLFVAEGTQVVPHVIRLLDGANVHLGAVSVAQPTLDEVFLRATGSRLEGAADGREDSSNGNH